MSQISTAVRTGMCDKCHASVVHILTLEPLTDSKGEVSTAPFSCPKCGHAGTLPSNAGERIVKVETKLYSAT